MILISIRIWKPLNHMELEAYPTPGIPHGHVLRQWKYGFWNFLHSKLWLIGHELGQYRVEYFLSAQLKPPLISSIIGVSLSTLHAIKQAIVNGKGLARKPDIVDRHRVLINYSMTLKAKITVDPKNYMKGFAFEI